jgi:signal transduction histidine kinase
MPRPVFGTDFRTILSRRWSNAVGMVAFALLVIGMFMAFMVVDLMRIRADAIRTSQRNTAGFALTLAENLGQTVAAVDQLLQAFVPKLDGSADRSLPAMGKVRSDLMGMTLAIPEVQIFAAFDAKGERFLNVTGWPYARSTNGASKDYFVAHRDNPNLGLSVSKVFQSASGYRIISLSRRLNNPDGSFAGTLAISMAPNYLQRVYDQAGFNRSGSISLYRTDGTLLIRHPDARNQVNRSFEKTPLFAAVLTEGPSGTLDSISPVDGVRRITSYRKVEGAPLVVAVSESYDEVLAGWRRMVDRYIALASLIAVAVSGLAYALHRQTENRLAADGRFRAALDSATNAFVLLSPIATPGGGLDFVIRDANMAAGMLFGRDREKIRGASLATIASEFCTKGVLASCQATYETGERLSTAVVVSQPEQHAKRWVRVRTTSYADGIVLSMRDATEEQESREALEAAKENAENANRAKSDFLANMSHELRTPLNAVIGFADIIAQQLFGPVGSDRYREYATLIRMSGAHLLEIISDILDLAKVEADRVVLDERKVEIPALLRICATLVAGRAEQAGVRVAINAQPDLPPLIADELRIKQVVLNLLSNAVKFSPPGTEVRLGSRLTDLGELAIVVSDRGCGMTADEIALALQPFGQATSSIAKSKEGTGLGLPLARRMTEIHGGSLDIVSVPGEGTVITVLLPASRVARPSPRRAKFSPESSHIAEVAQSPGA